MSVGLLDNPSLLVTFLPTCVLRDLVLTLEVVILLKINSFTAFQTVLMNKRCLNWIKTCND